MVAELNRKVGVAMASDSSSLGRQETTDGLLAPALGISIAIALFAVVVQSLAANGAISLSATQQLTLWLVAAGLVVLLWIAYMICHAYLTARAGKAEAEQARSAAAEADARRDEALTAQAAAGKKVKDTQEQLDRARQDAEQARAAATEANAQRDKALAAQVAAEQQVKVAEKKLDQAAEREAKVAWGPWKDGSQGEDRHAWVPPAELRRLDGSPVHVSTKAVFPNGCRLVPDSIGEAQDDDETETHGTVAPINRPQPVYQCRVVDENPELNGRSHEAVVILDQKPSLPSWARYALVEFDDLMITPYMTDRIRIGYTLHAACIKPAEGQKETA
jgi:hypothetical protein